MALDANPRTPGCSHLAISLHPVPARPRPAHVHADAPDATAPLACSAPLRLQEEAEAAAPAEEAAPAEAVPAAMPELQLNTQADAPAEEKKGGIDLTK